MVTKPESLPRRASGAGEVSQVQEDILFYRMVAHQQIDLRSIEWKGAQAAVDRALGTCALCPVKSGCVAWFARAEPPLSYVGFCPNAERIEVLRIMGP